MPPKFSPSSYQPRSTPLESHKANTVADYTTPDQVQNDVSTAPRPPALPPVASLTTFNSGITSTRTSTETDPPTSLRPFGVHSILNPTSEHDTNRGPHRISLSPSRTAGGAFGSYQTPLVSSRVRKRKEDASPGPAPQVSLESRPGRRLLTPKSPAMRSMSQGVRGSPSSGSSLKPMPGSGESRIYSAEPGDSSGGTIPPLPPINIASQGPVTSAPEQENLSGPTQGSYGNAGVSYLTNSQMYGESPGSSSNLAEREHTSPYQHPISEPGQFNPQGLAGLEAHIRSTRRSYGVGQSSYQMQLSTDSGTMILPVEVDLQQASKMADEKRKRNAGASARFRQRRKEKEHASSQHIAELQKQLRDLKEERDFYLEERNAFRDVVSRTPGAQLSVRPPSPRMVRPQVVSQYASGTSERPPNAEYGHRNVTEPPPTQRRRTSDYQPAFTPTSVPSPYPPSYPPQPPPPVAYSLPPPLAPTVQDPRNQPPLPGPTGQPGPSSLVNHPPHPIPPSTLSSVRPSTYDPFRRESHPR